MYNYYPQYNPNFLPAQQVVQANGKSSIDALRMAPNSSVLILDTTAPMVWLCTSDGLGNVTPIPYDITPHEEVKQEADLEKRIAAIEEKIEEVLNGKSNDGGTYVSKARPRKTSDGHDAKSANDDAADVC